MDILPERDTSKDREQLKIETKISYTIDTIDKNILLVPDRAYVILCTTYRRSSYFISPKTKCEVWKQSAVRCILCSPTLPKNAIFGRRCSLFFFGGMISRHV